VVPNSAESGLLPLREKIMIAIKHGILPLHYRGDTNACHRVLE
jgi:hypothetical protein